MIRLRLRLTRLEGRVGIQPIDLSTVYSQMDKMGQMNASQVQNAHLANRQHLEKAAQLQAQKAQSVNETAQSGEPAKIKADVNQGGGFGQALMQDEEKQDPSRREAHDEEKPAPYEIRDPKLGRHVDVTG